MEQDPSVILCYPTTYIIDGDELIKDTYDDKLHLVQENPTERFMAFLETIGLVHQHLRVIRTPRLRQTHLLRAHVASDINLLAEMTLYGKVYELHERLSSRRFHEISCSWKRGDDKHQAKRYKAAGSSLVDLRQWRSQIAHFASITTAPLLLGSKFRLYRRLTRVASWNREVLTAELSRYLRSIFPFHDGGAEWT